MTPEDRGGPGSQQSLQPTHPPDRAAALATGATESESLRLQIRQTRSELGETIADIERQIGTERLAARAEQVADHVIHEATERAKQVVLEATDHARDAAKDITDHALTETKLAIREMAGQASSAAREATIGKVENMVQKTSQRASGAGSGIVELIQRNPMASALAGLGLGWLYLSNRSSSGSTSTAARYYPRSTQYSTGYTGRTGESGHPASELASNVAETVGDKLGQAQAAARGAIDQVQDTAEDVAGRAQEMAQDAGSTATDVGSVLLDTIQKNPLPAALAAASLGYLIMNRPGAQPPAPVHDARYRAERAASQLRSSTGQLADEVQDTAGDMAERVQQATGQVASQAQDAIGEFGDSLQTQALRTQYRFEQYFSDHPLVVGAAALALGMAVGLPVPQTQQEHELMGQVSGKVIDRAQNVAQETAQKFQQAVEQQGQGPDEEILKKARIVAEGAEQLADKLNKPA